MSGDRTGQAVEVEQLTRRFGAFVAVDALSFSVATGEIFGLLGPNGAGKTTAIRMLTGLLAPSGGRATITGVDVASRAAEARQRIGYMSQLFSLYHDLTVDENIALFAGLYGIRGDRLRERRRWVLEVAGLTQQTGRLTAELPLGWKQRLALGCAVLHEPPVLFLDEPTSGVDPVSRRNFWDLIYSLAASGTTVLVSTHYMEEAEYCNRVALMNRGRLIALGRPAELRQNLAEPLLEVDVDDVLRGLEALRDEPSVLEAVMFGRRLHVTVKDPAEARVRIAAALSRAGLTSTRILPVSPSLEDVVVALIRESESATGAAAGGRL
ncbi:MAG: ABC transporter ATP-binding protein [Gemmatimonadales bacterium]